MNNAIRIVVLVVVVIVITVLVGVWGKMWLGSQNGSSVEQDQFSDVLADIPIELFEVAEEEYAIEFEGNEPVVDIDQDFCDIVKSQCEEQGIKNCEDYKTCVEGMGSN